MANGQTGVIEGFFGRAWSWEERADYARFLREIGFGFYIYAPKSDPYLRKNWRRDWPDSWARRIVDTAECYRDSGVAFGIGFSPYEIYLDLGSSAKKALRKKVRQLNAVDPDILCLLFDDMRGDVPNLARMQAEIVSEIAAVSTARRFIFCPTYYSFDPVLEKVFGAMPANYLADIGRQIDERVAIFWTGPRVCSTEYPRDHLIEVGELLRRKPFLWDNHLANDGAQMSNHLHLKASIARPDPRGDLLAGHAINPMNQPWLSRIPLRGISDRQREGDSHDPERSLFDACESLCGEKAGRELLADRALFQDAGLQRISDARRDELIAKYSQHKGNACTQELVEWLRGDYAFDPACLTD